MIDRVIKQSLGQMIKGVQVVGAAHEGLRRAYTSHWVCQVSFEEPILMASVSPKHDTHPLIAATDLFSVSLLAADQVEEGQYFSYPGRKFRYIGTEWLTDWDGLPVVPNAIAWLRCEAFEADSDARPRAVLRSCHCGARGTAEGAAAAVFEPARLARHRWQGA